jgi:hypothetical protein
MALRRDDAICRGATAARQDADGDDGTARCDRGEEGGVESGAQAQATVEQIGEWMSGLWNTDVQGALGRNAMGISA